MTPNIKINRYKTGCAAAVLALGVALAGVAKAQVADYQLYSQYPPESRPLHSRNWDLLNPWSTDPPTFPLLPPATVSQIESLAASGMEMEDIMANVTLPPGLPTFHFEMNRTILGGAGDQLVAVMTVNPPPGSSAPLSISVTKAEIFGDEDFGQPNLGSVPFSCDATSPVCTFRWSAPTQEKQYWGELVLRVTLSVAGMGDGFLAGESFYSSPMVAGSFTGKFQERLVNGSLLIDAGVTVQQRMACFVTANLFSVSTGAPTHHAERRMIVDPSDQTITFTFFGKIFTDFGYAGAFRLQDLRAQCMNLPYPPEWFMDSLAHQADLDNFDSTNAPASEPPYIYFSYNNFTYVTQSYANSVFSPLEWQSPDRTFKLQMLQQIEQDLNSLAQTVKP